MGNSDDFIKIAINRRARLMLTPFFGVHEIRMRLCLHSISYRINYFHFVNDGGSAAPDGQRRTRQLVRYVVIFGTLHLCSNELRLCLCLVTQTRVLKFLRGVHLTRFCVCSYYFLLDCRAGDVPGSGVLAGGHHLPDLHGGVQIVRGVRYADVRIPLFGISGNSVLQSEDTFAGFVYLEPLAALCPGGDGQLAGVLRRSVFLPW